MMLKCTLQCALGSVRLAVACVLYGLPSKPQACFGTSLASGTPPCVGAVYIVVGLVHWPSSRRAVMICNDNVILHYWM